MHVRMYDERPAGRIADAEHTERPWLVHDVAAGFELEDVWLLPGRGEAGDFPRLVELLCAMDPGKGSAPAASRALWAIRWKLGELLGWDDAQVGLGGRVQSLRARVPEDLRDDPALPQFAHLPFSSLYLTDDEFAAEIANQTVHGVMHLGRIADGDGGFRVQMAVLVRPNGVLGRAYLLAIRPFRRLVVYPAMMRQGERLWARLRAGQPVA